MGGFSIGAQVGQLAGGTNTDVPIWVGVHYTMDKVFQLTENDGCLGERFDR
jgi:hypothetical protein